MRVTKHELYIPIPLANFQSCILDIPKMKRCNSIETVKSKWSTIFYCCEWVSERQKVQNARIFASRENDKTFKRIDEESKTHIDLKEWIYETKKDCFYVMQITKCMFFSFSFQRSVNAPNAFTRRNKLNYFV